MRRRRLKRSLGGGRMRASDMHEIKDRDRIREAIVWHICKPRQARAFDFRSPVLGSAYAYSLSWTPGSLALAGDLGELTLVHYSALWDLEGGLSWATARDSSYLLSKSGAKKVLNRDATAEFLIEHANESVIEYAYEHCADDMPRRLQRWRMAEPECETKRRRLGFRKRLARTILTDDARADRRSWRRTRPAYEFTQKPRRDRWAPEVWAAPEGWDLWHKMRAQFADHLPREAIFTHAGRAEIKEELTSWLDDVGNSEQDVARMCSWELGMDDYYGTYDYDFGTIAKIEAIRYGACLALEIVRAEREAAPREVAHA